MTISPEPSLPDSHGENAPANPKPSGLEATVSGETVTLTWTPGSDDAYVKQVIKRRTVGQRGWTDFEVAMSDGEFVDDTVEAGNRYIYRVKMLRGNDKGPLSKPVRVNVR